MWYDLSGIPGEVEVLGITIKNGVIKNIHPAPSLGTWLSGDPQDGNKLYEVPSYPYRHFDQDATGRNVTFAAGHNLQFPAGVKVSATSPIGDCIRFVGTPSANTRLFSIRGMETGGLVAGIRICNGGRDSGEPTVALNTNPDGTFSTALTLPSEVPVGDYHVLADCPIGRSAEASATFRVSPL